MIKRLVRTVTQSSGSFCYGSFALTGSIRQANDIDVFSLSPGRHVHHRLIKHLGKKEIHEYVISQDVILADIRQTRFGEIHACNFWGPVILLIDSPAIRRLIVEARTKKIIKVLDYMLVLGIRSFTVVDVVNFLYFIEGIFKPYAFNIGCRVFKQTHGLLRSDVVRWLKEYDQILSSKKLKHRVQKEGNSYVFLRGRPKRFISIYTRQYIENLQFWRSYLEIHPQPWNSAFHHAQKHKVAFEEIEDYIRTFIYSSTWNKIGPRVS